MPKGYYLLINVGQMGKKADNLIAIKNAAVARGETVSPIIFLDGIRRFSKQALKEQ
jgi:hypothetical protein